jgi:hypothetical protein
MKLFKHYFWKITLLLLLFIAMGLVIWLIVNIRNLYKTGELRPAREFHGNYIHTQIISSDQIQAWMTFSYINYIFNLPPNYLLGALNIKDNRYPNLGINQYAKEKKLNYVSFLASVKGFVNQYTKNTQ